MTEADKIQNQEDTKDTSLAILRGKKCKFYQYVDRQPLIVFSLRMLLLTTIR